ncbi:MAG: hypothetical protein ABH804_03040 [archaeon]
MLSNYLVRNISPSDLEYLKTIMRDFYKEIEFKGFVPNSQREILERELEKIINGLKTENKMWGVVGIRSEQIVGFTKAHLWENNVDEYRRKRRCRNRVFYYTRAQKKWVGKSFKKRDNISDKRNEKKGC